MSITGSATSAAEDFRRARQQAALRDIIANVTGRSADLLSYEDVRRKLRGRISSKRERRDIPLDAIVGSVGRYADFTRDFLPRNDTTATRWQRVQQATREMQGVPPIEVYQIGDAYFVLDGNHRVSVARSSGDKYIQADVIPVETRVPLSATSSPDSLILMGEFADFLEETHLDELRPDADLRVTAPGQYPVLTQQIEQLRAAMAAELGREVDMPEAAARWYDTVYLPVAQAIRDQGILRDFPGRTETDLYLWISEQRAALERQLGWQVNPKDAVSDLVQRRSPRPRRVVGRLLGAVTPRLLASGPPPGTWRRTRRANPTDERLIADLLVACNGAEAGWQAVDQAIFVARHEGAHLTGLHVVATEAERDTPAVAALRAEFDRRCLEAGVAGSLTVDVGEVVEALCERARWTDLVVASLSYPPGTEPVARLRSGFRSLIQRCPRPILAVPRAVAALHSVLLPYDGSPKSEEALFAAAYLARHWQLSTVVITVADDDATTHPALERARRYLEEHGVAATYLLEHGPVTEAILRAADTYSSELIVIGGYGFNPLLEIVLGSTVDQVLRESRRLVLVCR